MTLPTASSLFRALSCPASCVLPGIRSENAAATRGSMIHAFLEDCSNLSREEALARLEPADRAICEIININALPVQLQAEVTFAYDGKTGRARRLGVGLHRDYSGATESEFTGTVDVYSHDADTVYVADYKTGHTPVGVKNNPQLLFGALCACRVHNCKSAVAGIIYVNPDTGDIRDEHTTVSALELEEFESRLRALYNRLQTPDPRALITEGEHCKYCPALIYCPAKTALIKRLANEEFALGQALTPETASVALEKLTLAKDLLRKAESMIYAYARQHPIAASNGRLFGYVKRDGYERIDGEIAHTVIRERYGREAADSAVSMSTTKADINKSLRLVLADGQKLTPTVREVLDEIRRRGGTLRPVSEKLTYYYPDEEK